MVYPTLGGEAGEVMMDNHISYNIPKGRINAASPPFNTNKIGISIFNHQPPQKARTMATAAVDLVVDLVSYSMKNKARTKTKDN